MVLRAESARGCNTIIEPTGTVSCGAVSPDPSSRWSIKSGR